MKTKIILVKPASIITLIASCIFVFFLIITTKSSAIESGYLVQSTVCHTGENGAPYDKTCTYTWVDVSGNPHSEDYTHSGLQDSTTDGSCNNQSCQYQIGQSGVAYCTSSSVSNGTCIYTSTTWSCVSGSTDVQSTSVTRTNGTCASVSAHN